MRCSVFQTFKMGMAAFVVAPSLALAAWNHFDPADTSKVPKKFSATGFYSNMSTKVVTTEAVAFEVNSPLWSDNAHKHRWVLLKAGSKKIQFDPNTDYLNYPDSAVFVKLFQHDTIQTTNQNDSSSRIYWETRVLINKKIHDTISTDPLSVVINDYWYAFSYKWAKDGSDAYLVSAKKGLDTSMTLIVKGQKSFRKWTFPSVKNGCDKCHRQYSNDTQGRSVLGFFAHQLNRPTTTDPNLNQIRMLFQKNILGWSKVDPTEVEIKAMPRWARITDTSAPLDLRARAYIGANCSGCHGTRGIATEAIYPASINYDFFKVTGASLIPEMEFRHYSTAGYGLLPLVKGVGDTIKPQLIVPGYPELSTILKRMKSRNTTAPGTSNDTAFIPDVNQMPPIGVYEEDTVATRWIAKWIKEMPEVGISRRRVPILGTFKPSIVGNILILPAGLDGKVLFVGIGGKKFELTRTNGNDFRLPDNLKPGVYMLRVGIQTFKVLH
jgi:hypothetical protein